MKLQFTTQQYQTDAVESVVDVFAGQPRDPGPQYMIDPGRQTAKQMESAVTLTGLRNAEIALDSASLLEGIQRVQRLRNLPVSSTLATSAAAPGRPNLDVEMETGTGKTYVYIKTMMEMHRRYGWTKFIVVVPSVAIREGVKKTFDITAQHFQQEYGTRPQAFVYDSSRLHEIEAYSSNSGVQVMIINIQAFNSSGKDNRRIYDVLDDFQSRRPIDVIAANRPIVIIDEPQKIGAAKSLASLSNFNALMVLRYSATHTVEHNKVHRLDALDAFNQRLVKRIEVRGITVKGLSGTTAYLHISDIEVRPGGSPRARVELEVQSPSGTIRRKLAWVTKGTNLHDLSGGLEAYRGLLVTDVDAYRNVLELSNGDLVEAGQLATDDVTEDTKRRIQIREVVAAHLARERELFRRGIKVLSLFFIGEVVKYRDYEREDTLGDYARMFEEEYAEAKDALLQELEFEDEAPYRAYLRRDAPADVHSGYFSVDRKTRRPVDGKIAARGDEKGQSTDADAYDLILKDKERLLSLDEPVRFLFSHSALREGWDNPNVFTLGMLKRSDNGVSRRQEIGRGLRLAVDQNGIRQDDPATVHQINRLTVVTDESYTDFVTGLQREIAESLKGRPRKASLEYLTGRTITTESGESLTLNAELAGLLYKHLIRSGYIDDEELVTQAYVDARDADELALPANEDLLGVIDVCWPLIDAVHTGVDIVEPGRTMKRLPVNQTNLHRREFQELWQRINRKAVYRVEFDSEELIAKAVDALNTGIRVSGLTYTVESGTQGEHLEAEHLRGGRGFVADKVSTRKEDTVSRSQVAYDLLGEITERTALTRRTVSAILRGIRPDVFANFSKNPEQFLTEAGRIINEQKASTVIEHLAYSPLEDTHDISLFSENQTSQDFTKATTLLTKHVYDYVVTDSDVEKEFVAKLDASAEVAVYAKLPGGFTIPTPVGDYNPDWAIAFDDADTQVRHVYFVAETKGSLSSLQLRGVEGTKIACARRFFAALNAKDQGAVRYDVVTDYNGLMDLVKGA
ncbi:type III restriction-modification system endonuclease [Micrococcus luteus]|uniref:type III restriction-modification system endonuclease n=1 Tax=Micrococcus luteus TaxID=1270 RepID=UPI0036A3295C